MVRVEACHPPSAVKSSSDAHTSPGVGSARRRRASTYISAAVFRICCTDVASGVHWEVDRDHQELTAFGEQVAQYVGFSHIDFPAAAIGTFKRVGIYIVDCSTHDPEPWSRPPLLPTVTPPLSTMLAPCRHRRALPPSRARAPSVLPAHHRHVCLAAAARDRLRQCQGEQSPDFLRRQRQVHRGEHWQQPGARVTSRAEVHRGPWRHCQRHTIPSAPHRVLPIQCAGHAYSPGKFTLAHSFP